jgi:hypothetical protein
MTLEELERQHIERTLRHHNGNHCAQRRLRLPPLINKTSGMISRCLGGRAARRVKGA